MADQPKQYGLWRVDKDRWSTHSWSTDRKTLHTPVVLSSLDEARDFETWASKGVGLYEVREYLSNGASQKLGVSPTAPSKDVSMTPTLNAFRPGDSIFVFVDSNGNLAPAGKAIPATIIAKSPTYMVLGWKDGEETPASALPRMKGTSPTYIATEQEYTRACTAPHTTACGAVKPFTDTIGQAKLGDEVYVFLDADDNLVPFQTNSTTKAIVIGRAGTQVILGWKQDQKLPGNVVPANRVPRNETTYIEGESLYASSYALDLVSPCFLPKATKKPQQVETPATKQTKPVAPGTITTLGQTKPGDRVKMWVDSNGRFSETPTKVSVEVFVGGIHDSKWSGLYGLLVWNANNDSPLKIEEGRDPSYMVRTYGSDLIYTNDMLKYERAYLRPVSFACEILPDETLLLREENAKLKTELEALKTVQAANNNATEAPTNKPAEEPQANPTTSTPLKHGQRVRWKDKCNGWYVEVRIGEDKTAYRIVLLDEPLDVPAPLFPHKDELRNLGKEFGHIINDEGTNWAGFFEREVKAIDDKPIISNATQTTEARPPTQEVEQTEETTNQSSDLGATAVIVAGMLAGVAMDAIAKAGHSPHEAARVKPPTQANDSDDLPEAPTQAMQTA